MSESITVPGYRIERKLGQGGMAAVYLAIQQSFGRKVALKIMSPLLNSDPSFTTRFMREARIVAHIHHASIVPVFDVGEHQPYHYLSMEYLPGGDLKQRILTGSGNPQLLAEVCGALCPALDLAHRKGFVHRDIKPENVLFREDGTPVLTDFGIARAVDSGTSLTMAGMLVGTPSYMSPEQVKGNELDGRSDLYSLGIVCYEILTGTVPFRADSTLSVALKHLSEPLPTLPASLARYQEFLNRMTAKERDERFASGAQVLQALRTIDRPAPAEVTLLRPRSDEFKARTGAGSSLRQRMLPAAIRASDIALAHVKALWAKVPAFRAISLPKISIPKLSVPRIAIPKIAIPKVAIPEISFPKFAIPGPPVIDRRIAAWIGGGMAALLVVAIAIRAQRDGVENEQPVAAAPATPVPQAQTPADSTAQVADSATTEAPPEEMPTATTAPAEDPELVAAREARLAEERSRRQAELQRQLAEQQQREAEAKAAALRSQQEKIRQLLASAKTLYAQGALALPRGASAADRYHEVLQLQSDQPEATAGRQRIARVLTEEALHAESVRDADALRALIPQIAWVQPGHPKLVELQSALNEIQSNPTERSRREAASLDRAAKHVAKAYEYLDREPYDLRAADAATDEYDRASSALASAPGLPLLRERLIGSYAEAAQTELAGNDTKAALRVISVARKRKWMSPELEQIETRIQQARLGAE